MVKRVIRSRKSKKDRQYNVQKWQLGAVNQRTENTMVKRVIRSRKSWKDRQYNGQKGN